jgi:hypothetical protein
MRGRGIASFVLSAAVAVGTVTAAPHVSSIEVTPVNSASAITGMWAWGNDVSPSDDFRGLGQPQFAPATLAAFAGDHGLRSVRLSVPWAADQGTAFATSLSQSVDALHAQGSEVAALGGDAGWVADPALAVQWMTAAHAVAAFDSVQLDVEPWTSPDWPTDTAAIAQFVTMVAAAQSAAHSMGMQLGVDLPWWLADKPYAASTILDALLPHLDSVSIVAFADHASGDDGIISLSSPAAQQAAAAGVPFTIGVETDTPAVAGGSQYTFYDEGSAELEAAADTVRIAYSATPGYQGVVVEHYLSWLSLKP